MTDLADLKSNDVQEGRLSLASLLLFVVIACLVAADLVVDYGEGGGLAHLLAEGFVLLLACLGAALLWRRLQAAKARVTHLQFDLSAAKAEASRWRRENEQVLKGLGAAIEAQFRRWELTPAEQEVALLLLKGLGHREIAEVRSTSERTAREQARAVYRKAGVTGRAALSAFFLEDLLLPMAAADRAGA
ncbi:MAG TPA: LuxR C-terminal-related transcriptional regulator [Pseudohaliea sp.]|nr:LuxR C-terminal-related transcriptional regulator [Pseudohaliea sp.]